MATAAKKTLLFLVPFLLMAQEEVYPPESFYGGGVGFSQMFLFVDVGKLDGFELLGTVTDTAGVTKGLGLSTDDFTNPFVINGGEGFSNITGRWRLGGYAGVGSSFISGKPTIRMFLDQDEDGEFDVGSETSVEYGGNYAPDLQAKISVWISGATVEYVFPVFRGLEVAAGMLMGLGRLNLTVSQSSGSPAWEDQFGSIFQIGSDGLYGVTDANGDSLINSDDIAFVEASEFPSLAIGRGMTSLTGTFFDMQPYGAVKLQFLDRVGLRLSIGFNLGQVGKGTWETDNRHPISDSPSTSLNGLAVRAMIYFGL
ncbi:MAG: hypothetical protein ACE5GH_04775 [Fidelibacterota bacterium]